MTGVTWTTGYSREYWILDSGFWKPDTGYWILDSGF